MPRPILHARRNTPSIAAPLPDKLARVHCVTPNGVVTYVAIIPRREPCPVTQQDREDARPLSAAPRSSNWPTRSKATLA